MFLSTICFAEVPAGVATDQLGTAPPGVSRTIGTDPAGEMVNRMVRQLALGPAFDAKVRQRVWVDDREVVGVGSYEQAGRGTGWFNLQITMHDGDGKHTLQQISDGRLAWTRQQVGESISLRRVDVGRLDQWVADANPTWDLRSSQPQALTPSAGVGGIAELLTKIATDHDLILGSGRLDGREVWIITGNLRPEVRQEWMATFQVAEWPHRCPTQVFVAIAKANAANEDFGQGLPLRIEFRGEPRSRPDAGKRDTSEPASTPARPLISLIELYSIRSISPPPIERFRFENHDPNVSFLNETDRYLARYGIRLTERQIRQLRR